MSATKYRLVTRSDFDGLVCAVLLKELEMIDEILFAHPKDMADGKVEITDRDITTNLPYDPRCHLAFDHHESEAIWHADKMPGNFILDAQADSAARVVYRHYGGRQRFSNIAPEMMMAVDKADAARFTEGEVTQPFGWVLLNFLMDPRTGLGRFREFRVSNYNLMMNLIDYCRDHTIDEILALPDVRERVDLYYEHRDEAIEQILRCSTVHDKLVVLNLKDEKTIYATNRFMIYALHPQCNISIHVLWGRQGQNTVFAIGRSILDRSSEINIGELALKLGGGGHAAAGTIQVDNEQAEAILEVVIARIIGRAPARSDEQAESRDLPAMIGESTAPSAAAESVDVERAVGALEDDSEAITLELPTRKDVLEIRDRLDRIEQMLAELLVPTPR